MALFTVTAALKEEILNDQFVSVYTKEVTFKIASKWESQAPIMDPIQLQCKGVHKLLQNLEIHTATGPGGILTFILRACSPQCSQPPPLLWYDQDWNTPARCEILPLSETSTTWNKYDAELPGSVTETTGNEHQDV